MTSMSQLSGIRVRGKQYGGGSKGSANGTGCTVETLSGWTQPENQRAEPLITRGDPSLRNGEKKALAEQSAAFLKKARLA